MNYHISHKKENFHRSQEGIHQYTFIKKKITLIKNLYKLFTSKRNKTLGSSQSVQFVGYIEQFPHELSH
jgi:hypothetical protein